jgi:hypothetical protein
MANPNWHEIASTIVDETLVALQELGNSCSDETWLFLAYGVNFCEGSVTVNIDTPVNSAKKAKRRAWRIKESQQRILQTERTWETARYYLTRDRMSFVSLEIGEFAHYQLRHLVFDEWADYFHELGEEAEDSLSHVLVMFIEIARRLSNNQAFPHARLHSPFYLGAYFIDTDIGMLILDILRWPEEKSEENKGENKGDENKEDVSIC